VKKGTLRKEKGKGASLPDVRTRCINTKKGGKKRGEKLIGEKKR